MINLINIFLLRNQNFQRKNLGIVFKLHFWYYTNLSELINFYSPPKSTKNIGFLMISGETEIN